MFNPPEIEQFPQRLEIEPTDRCNATCPYCPRHHMKTPMGFMDLGLFKRLIDEIVQYPDRSIVLFRRGETLLHPKFGDMLDYVKGKFNDIQLTTNASVMKEKIAHKIADVVTDISFSLELPERFQMYRTFNYDTIIARVDYFLSINKKARTQVSVVRTGDMTDDEIERFKENWSKKVDRVRIYEEHSQDGKFGSLKEKRRVRKPCVKPFNDMLIYWDGQVGRCNHDWGSAPLDSVQNKTIAEVWKGMVYKNLRKEHIGLTFRDKICGSCDSWYEFKGKSEIGQLIEVSQNTNESRI